MIQAFALRGCLVLKGMIWFYTFVQNLFLHLQIKFYVFRSEIFGKSIKQIMKNDNNW